MRKIGDSGSARGAWIATFALVMLVAGCGGGGGGGGGGNGNVGVTGIRISPDDGSTGAPVAARPTIYSDTAVINCNAVSTANFTLATEVGVAVAGSIGCTDHEATFYPDASLLPNTKYVAHVTTMTDAGGVELCAGGCTWRFTTGDAPFAVDRIAPANGATEVPLATPLTVTFNKALDCATVTDTTFSVMDQLGNVVSGAVTCDSATATFTPSATLTPSRIHIATMAATVKDAGGATLAEAPRWSFKTNSAGQIVIFKQQPGNAALPLENRWLQGMGADTNGNVMMVYKQRLGLGAATEFRALAMRYKKYGGWDQDSLDLGITDETTPVKVAVSKNGNAVVLWHGDGLGNDLFAAHYTRNSGAGIWSTVVVSADSPNKGKFTPNVWMDDVGNAMVTWVVWNPGDNEQVYARYYSATEGWKATHQVTLPIYHNLAPRFAFAPNGNGAVVFSNWQNVGNGNTAYRIESRDYDATTDTWSSTVMQIREGFSVAPPTMNPNLIGSVYSPDIAFDANGKAFMVWAENILGNPDAPPADFYRYTMVNGATRAAPGSDWGLAHVGVGWDPKGDAGSPRITMMPNGDALVTWPYYRRGETEAHLNAAYHAADAGTHWASAGDSIIQDFNYGEWRVLGADSNGGILSWSLVVDANGKVTLVYEKSDGTRSNIYSKTFSYEKRSLGVASGWSESREIDATNNNSTGPLIAVTGADTTMVLWNQDTNVINDHWLNNFWHMKQ